MVTRTHDHEIVVGSTRTRLDLLRDQSGRALYSVIEEVPEYGRQIKFQQKDWSGGHGQYNFSDPTMSFEGRAIDTTQEGRVILGPLKTEVESASTQQENYTTGGGTNLDVYGAFWEAQTFTPASSHTIGSVKIKVSRIGLPGTVTVSIKATTGVVPSGSDLTTGTLNGNDLSTTLGWQTIDFGSGTALTSGTLYAIVVRAIDGTSTNKMLWDVDPAGASYSGGTRVTSTTSGASWVSSSDADHMFEEWSLAATELDAAPVTFLWAATAGKLLCATSGKIYLYTDAWAAAATTIAGVLDLKEYDGIIYAAVGASTSYYYSSDGDTWTQTNLTDGYANQFLIAPNTAGTQDVLWKFKTPNEVSSTTDGRTVAAGGVQWTSPAYIGDTSNNITSLFLVGDNLMAGRTDGLFNYDSDGGIHQLMGDLRQNRSTQNFKYTASWQASSYFSLIRGAGEISPALVFSPIGPLQDTGDIDKIGDVVGMASDKEWLYIAVLEETLIHIYRGRRRKNGLWSWCPWVYLGTNNCATIAVVQHTSTDRRLWFGYGTHTGYVVLTDNPTADSSARFDTSNDNWLRMSYTYGTNPYWDKLFQSVVTETKGCTSTRTVTPKYRKDTDTTATALTEAITTNGVVKTNLTSALTSNKIQFELHLTTTDSLVTPEVLFFEARGTEKPETVRVHECVYAIGDNPSRRAETLRTTIRGARTSTGLVKFADLRYGDDTSGTSYVWVVMQPGYPQEVEVEQEKGRAPELGMKVRWQEVSFTIS